MILPVPDSFFFAAGRHRPGRLLRPLSASSGRRRSSRSDRVDAPLRAARSTASSSRARSASCSGVLGPAPARHALVCALRDDVALENFAPTFIYVIFWLGMPLLSVLFGDVWRVLSPWRAIADFFVWLLELGGREAQPLFAYPERLGRYPGRRARCSPSSRSSSRTRGLPTRGCSVSRVALYTYWALAGMAVFGRCGVDEGREGFAVAFGLLARIAPFTDARRAARAPLAVHRASAARIRFAGSLAVDRGHARLDELRRLQQDDDLAGPARGRARGSRRCPDWRVDLTISLGQPRRASVFVAGVAVAYLLAVAVARGSVRSRRDPRARVPALARPDRVRVPPSRTTSRSFLIQGQFLIPLASDPLGRGWDLFGTADFEPESRASSRRRPSGTCRSAALVDRSRCRPRCRARPGGGAVPAAGHALRSQYPMLALMVLFTVGGLWLLSQG